MRGRESIYVHLEMYRHNPICWPRYRPRYRLLRGPRCSSCCGLQLEPRCYPRGPRHGLRLVAVVANTFVASPVAVVVLAIAVDAIAGE
jgi:hypothetical protein